MPLSPVLEWSYIVKAEDGGGGRIHSFPLLSAAMCNKKHTVPSLELVANRVEKHPSPPVLDLNPGSSAYQFRASDFSPINGDNNT